MPVKKVEGYRQGGGPFFGDLPAISYDNRNQTEKKVPFK